MKHIIVWTAAPLLILSLAAFFVPVPFMKLMAVPCVVAYALPLVWARPSWRLLKGTLTAVILTWALVNVSVWWPETVRVSAAPVHAAALVRNPCDTCRDSGVWWCLIVGCLP